MPNPPDTLIQTAKEKAQKRAISELIRIAEETAQKRATSDPWLVAAYLTGSLRSENPFLGNITDIDIVFRGMSTGVRPVKRWDWTGYPLANGWLGWTISWIPSRKYWRRRPPARAYRTSIYGDSVRTTYLPNCG